MTKIMMREPFVKEIQPISKDLIENPSSSLVITLSKSGDALSLFSDDIWDYSATSSLMRTINFRTKIKNLSSSINTDGREFKSAVKFLKVFALNWICEMNGCSMSKLNGDLVAISFLISYCVNNNIELDNVFADPNAICFLVTNSSAEKQIGLYLGKIQRFIDTASVLNRNNFWCNIQPSEEFSSSLRKTRKSFPETSQGLQTMIIPSRIYQNLLKDTIESLQIFNKHAEKISYVFSARTKVRDEALRLDQSMPISKLNKSQTSLVSFYWKTALKRDKKLTNILAELTDLNIIKNASWLSLTISLGQIQMKSAFVIAAFTGMRKNELLSIPFNGLRHIHSDTGNIPVVWSTTTKLESNGVPRFTKWVTGSIVEEAFEAAKFITQGVLNWSANKSQVAEDESKLPLFFSIENGKSGKPHPHFDYATTALNSNLIQKIMSSEHLLISEQDLKEVSQFLYGDEIPNNIKLGEPWPLGFHQFRRSLAVYAASSGYVSYPTLKSQLKHISMMMTVYYTDSNSRAINILGNGPEVKAMQKEWQEAQARVESDNLHELLDSRVTLTGAAGKNLQKRKVENKLPKFLDNRNSTKKAVKDGKIRYRSTLVGGCMSIKPCDKGAGVLASACISCENAVFSPESKSILLQTKDFYKSQLTLDIPKRVHHEYEVSIKKIDSLLSVLEVNQEK